MNKISTTAALFVAILLICICAATGCSSGPEGRWQLVSASMGGKEIELENANGISVMELTLDGTAIFYGADSQTSKGSWIYKDDILYIDNSAVEYNGDRITMTVFGIDVGFQRV